MTSRATVNGMEGDSECVNDMEGDSECVNDIEGDSLISNFRCE